MADQVRATIAELYERLAGDDDGVMMPFKLSSPKKGAIE